MSRKIMAIDPVAFKLGPFTVAWYGLIIVAAMLLAIALTIKEAEKRDLTEDFVVDTAFWAIPLGILGARVYYVLFELEAYLADPIRMFYIWEGGLAIYGGIIAGVLVIYHRSQKDNIPPLLVTDILVPYVLIGQAIGRWGNFMNQEAHGGEVSRHFLEKLMLPEFIINQMNIRGSYYHPTFLYESVWNLIGAAVIYYIRKQDKFLLRGETTAAYMIWYGVGRFFIEGMRTDSLYMGGFRISQIISLLLVVVGVAFVIYQRKIKYPKDPYYTEGLSPEKNFAIRKKRYQENR